MHSMLQEQAMPLADALVAQLVPTYVVTAWALSAAMLAAAIILIAAHLLAMQRAAGAAPTRVTPIGRSILRRAATVWSPRSEVAGDVALAVGGRRIETRSPDSFLFVVGHRM